MTEFVDRLAGPLVSAEDALARESEARLADSSALAFRVAYSVLRHRQDAEDVAQEAFAKAYRSIDDRSIAYLKSILSALTALSPSSDGVLSNRAIAR